MSAEDKAAAEILEAKKKVEADVAARVQTEIRARAMLEVDEYVKGAEYKAMVEDLKRKERSRMLEQVQAEVEEERKKLVAAEKERLKSEQEDRMLLEQRAKDAASQQRLKELEARAEADSARLQEVERKQREEEQIEADRQVGPILPTRPNDNLKRKPLKASVFLLLSLFPFPLSLPTTTTTTPHPRRASRIAVAHISLSILLYLLNLISNDGERGRILDNA